MILPVLTATATQPDNSPSIGITVDTASTETSETSGMDTGDRNLSVTCSESTERSNIKDKETKSLPTMDDDCEGESQSDRDGKEMEDEETNKNVSKEITRGCSSAFHSQNIELEVGEGVHSNQGSENVETHSSQAAGVTQGTLHNQSRSSSSVSVETCPKQDDMDDEDIIFVKEQVGVQKAHPKAKGSFKEKHFRIKLLPLSSGRKSPGNAISVEQMYSSGHNKNPASSVRSTSIVNPKSNAFILPKSVLTSFASGVSLSSALNISNLSPQFTKSPMLTKFLTTQSSARNNKNTWTTNVNSSAPGNPLKPPPPAQKETNTKDKFQSLLNSPETSAANSATENVKSTSASGLLQYLKKSAGRNETIVLQNPGLNKSLLSHDIAKHLKLNPLPTASPHRSDKISTTTLTVSQENGITIVKPQMKMINGNVVYVTDPDEITSTKSNSVNKDQPASNLPPGFQLVQVGPFKPGAAPVNVQVPVTLLTQAALPTAGRTKPQYTMIANPQVPKHRKRTHLEASSAFFMTKSKPGSSQAKIRSNVLAKASAQVRHKPGKLITTQSVSVLPTCFNKSSMADSVAYSTKLSEFKGSSSPIILVPAFPSKHNEAPILVSNTDTSCSTDKLTTLRILRNENGKLICLDTQNQNAPKNLMPETKTTEVKPKHAMLTKLTENSVPKVEGTAKTDKNSKKLASIIERLKTAKMGSQEKEAGEKEKTSTDKKLVQVSSAASSISSSTIGTGISGFSTLSQLLQVPIQTTSNAISDSSSSRIIKIMPSKGPQQGTNADFKSSGKEPSEQVHMIKSSHSSDSDNKSMSESSCDIRIESVFSLVDNSCLEGRAEKSNSFSTLTDYCQYGTKHLALNASDGETTESDVENYLQNDHDDPRPQSYNLCSSEWKQVCTAAFVVPEKLSKTDVEAWKSGLNEFHFRCSKHCRQRTLSYLCNLNLLGCENKGSHSAGKDWPENDSNDEVITLDEDFSGNANMQKQVPSFKEILINDTQIASLQKTNTSFSSASSSKAKLLPLYERPSPLCVKRRRIMKLRGKQWTNSAISDNTLSHPHSSSSFSTSFANVCEDVDKTTTTITAKSTKNFVPIAPSISPTSSSSQSNAPPHSFKSSDKTSSVFCSVSSASGVSINESVTSSSPSALLQEVVMPTTEKVKSASTKTVHALSSSSTSSIKVSLLSPAFQKKTPNVPSKSDTNLVSSENVLEISPPSASIVTSASFSSPSLGSTSSSTCQTSPMVSPQTSTSGEPNFYTRLLRLQQLVNEKRAEMHERKQKTIQKRLEKNEKSTPLSGKEPTINGVPINPKFLLENYTFQKRLSAPGTVLCPKDPSLLPEISFPPSNDKPETGDAGTKTAKAQCDSSLKSINQLSKATTSLKQIVLKTPSTSAAPIKQKTTIAAHPSFFKVSVQGLQKVSKPLPATVPAPKPMACPTLPHINEQIKTTLRSLFSHFTTGKNVVQYVMLHFSNQQVLVQVPSSARTPQGIDFTKVRIVSSTPVTNPNAATSSKPQKTSQAPASMRPAIVPSSNNSVSLTQQASASQSKKKQLQMGKITNYLNRSSKEKATSSSIGAAVVSSTTTMTQIPVIVSSTNSSGRSRSVLLTCNSGQQQSTTPSTSILSRLPQNSSLLPEKRKMPSHQNLTPEQRRIKRRKLEAKYPLPPGVVIKCEPDDSEYTLNDTWSVTSEFTSRLPNQRMDSTQTSGGRVPAVHQGHSQLNTTTVVRSHSSSQAPAILNVSNERDGPPVLIHRGAAGTEPMSSKKSRKSTPSKNLAATSIADMDTAEDLPPVLQPMVTTTSHHAQEIVDVDELMGNAISNASSSPSFAGRTCDSSLSIFNGYSTTQPMQSAASMTSHLQKDGSSAPASSRIQQLKELLKKKEMQVENLRKQRSVESMFEV